MRIILEAFNGKMKSQVMDIPDNGTPTFDIALMQPLTAISGFDGTDVSTIPPLATRCTFEWVGKYYSLPEEQGGPAKIYVLRDIRKV